MVGERKKEEVEHFAKDFANAFECERVRSHDLNAYLAGNIRKYDPTQPLPAFWVTKLLILHQNNL
jgi:hypothetical protein